MFTINQATDAFIAIDCQCDFCKDGSLAVLDGDAVMPIINELTPRFSRNRCIASQDWHINPGDHFGNPPDFVDSWPVHCMANSAGAAFHPDLDVHSFGCIIQKGMDAAAYSAFDGFTDEDVSLHDYLQAQGVERIFLGGLATDYCVLQTALAGRRLGYEVVVILSACRAIAAPLDDGTEKTTLDAAIEKMRTAGVTLVEAI